MGLTADEQAFAERFTVAAIELYKLDRPRAEAVLVRVERMGQLAAEFREAAATVADIGDHNKRAPAS